MRSPRPPRIATWLFNRLGPRNAELAGDLIEEYKSGRSSAWYWRQVLIAVAVGFRTEISNHKFLAAKAVVISWTVLYLVIYNAWHLIPGLQQHSPLVRFFFVHGYSILGVLIPLVNFVISLAAALVVGWTNKRYHSAAVLILLASFTLSFGYSTYSEWIRLIVDSIDQPRFRPYLAYLLLRLLAGIVGISLGGLWSTPTGALSPTSSGPAQID